MDADNIANEGNDGQNIACNFLSSDDVLAYTQWAGLRIMTEVEFEKICRGVKIPSEPGEYAWGTKALLEANSILYSGTDSETVSQAGAGLCNFNGSATLPDGPLRCGFAAKLTTTRAQAGAAFYGVMEMSGNVSELVFISNLATTNGNGNPLERMSGMLNNGVPVQFSNSTNGCVLRGGDWNSTYTFLRTSDRALASSGNTLILRSATTGGRGVK